MSREPKMSQRRGRDYYSTKRNGVEYNLGTDEAVAKRKFYAIWGRSEQPAETMFAVDLLDSYLEWSDRNHAPATHKRIKPSIDSFAALLPAGLRVNKLLRRHLTDWLDKRCPKRPQDGSKPVSDNTRHDYASDVLGVFNWAVKQGIIPYSPLNGYRKPPKTPRAACLTHEQWEQVMACVDVSDPFYDFVTILRQTGCRPQEARIITSRHIDFTAAKVRFEDGEVPGKKGDREILLNDVAAAILKRYADQYPEGPVLRNTRGRPWGKNSLNSRFQRLKDKLPFRVHSYVARHSVATDMLEAGASAGAVAAVLGHRDPTMVLKTYGRHIEKREDHLRACLDRATKR